MGNRVAYLPAYEAEVEYLESTGTQWIDTGIVLENKLNSRFIIEYSALSSNNGNIISGLAGNAFKGPSVGMNIKSGQLIFVYSLSTSTRDTAVEGYYDTFYEYDLNGVDGYYKVIDTDNNEVVVNVTPITTGSYTQNTLSIILFAYQTITDDGTVVNLRKYRIKKCSIYDNNILVRDFIPVRIGATGYMYDKVSRQLFANAGTGQFVLGNDVANATVPQLRHVVYFGGQRCVGFETQTCA